MGLAAVLLAGVLLVGPTLILLAFGRSYHMQWEWQAPGQAWLGGLVSVAATGLAARLGWQLWRDETALRWTVLVSLLALLVVVAFGGLLVLRSGSFRGGLVFDSAAPTGHASRRPPRDPAETRRAGKPCVAPARQLHRVRVPVGHGDEERERRGFMSSSFA